MTGDTVTRAYAGPRACAEMGVDTDAAVAAASLSIAGRGRHRRVRGEWFGPRRQAGRVRQLQQADRRRTAPRRRDGASLLPVVSLHARQLSGSGREGGPEVRPEHFARWADWARDRSSARHPTFFAHRLASRRVHAAHPDGGVQQFWVRLRDRLPAGRRVPGGRTGRRVSEHLDPDGSKDTPADRKTPRDRLTQSRRIFAGPLGPGVNKDAVEAKLFGLGSEAYVVGSHEFYLGYAIRNRKVLCLDAGHFHPTEGIADKVSAVLPYVPELLLHLSRGLRWDSDHVVTLTDDLVATTQEVVRGGFLGRVHLGLDFFDASINRVAAWVIGARALRKALSPPCSAIELLRRLERDGDLTGRLAMEEAKSLPIGAVWDHACLTAGVPVGRRWLDEVSGTNAGAGERSSGCSLTPCCSPTCRSRTAGPGCRACRSTCGPVVHALIGENGAGKSRLSIVTGPSAGRRKIRSPASVPDNDGRARADHGHLPAAALFPT